ncbi:LPS export ABC transporter periplasmic protein LptC [bacterium]|nr:LPS export ABC transporter periplasmic protein LptC [bacterium]
MKKLLILPGALAVALGSWWGTQFVAQWTQPRPIPSATPAGPAFTFAQVDLVEFGEGAKLWDLKADAVVYDSEHHVANLSGIHARFWEGGRVVSTADAPEAVFDTDTRDLRMKGGIQVEAARSDTAVRADEVVWQAASQSLHAKGDVKFSRGVSRLEGPELWANRSLEQVRMGAPVRAIVQVETGWD